MRILVSDYSGHPFQVQLSRALAARGHDVLHVYSASFQTPKGDLVRRDDDPAGFAITGVFSSEEFRKDSFVKRRSQEIEVGGLIGAEIARFRPDVVFSSNAPIDSQTRIYRATRAAGAKFVFWIQDLYGEAIWRILRDRFGIAGHLVGRFYQGIERRLVRASDHVVGISADFRTMIAAQMGILPEKISVIENWAPLEDVPVLPRENAWAAANMPASPIRFLYSGTLGFKHDPGLLLKLAQATDGDVVVFSEGKAAKQLGEDAAGEGTGNLSVRSWLPFDVLPSALAGGDVLIVILEPDAGLFSVPSKVLTYMCAGRPILASIPKSNLAARIIEGAEAGLVIEPGDHAGFVAAAARLRADPDLRARMGKNARAHAEHVFDINRISGKFEDIAVQLRTDKA